MLHRFVFDVNRSLNLLHKKSDEADIKKNCFRVAPQKYIT